MNVLFTISTELPCMNLNSLTRHSRGHHGSYQEDTSCVSVWLTLNRVGDECILCSFLFFIIIAISTTAIYPRTILHSSPLFTIIYARVKNIVHVFLSTSNGFLQLRHIQRRMRVITSWGNFFRLLKLRLQTYDIIINMRIVLSGNG